MGWEGTNLRQNHAVPKRLKRAFAEEGEQEARAQMQRVGVKKRFAAATFFRGRVSLSSLKTPHVQRPHSARSQSLSLSPSVQPWYVTGPVAAPAGVAPAKPSSARRMPWPPPAGCAAVAPRPVPTPLSSPRFSAPRPWRSSHDVPMLCFGF